MRIDRKDTLTDCPIGCGAQLATSYFPGNAQKLKICPGCSVVFVDPLPSTFELQQVYSAAYFENKYENLIESGYVNAQNAQNGMADCFRAVTSMCQSIEGRTGTLLDVGCGTGRFMELARGEGWRVVGLEFFPDVAVETARRLGATVHVGGVLEVGDKVATSSVDVVTLFDVIEHLGKPVDALRFCHRILKPGGAIALSTPNFSGLGRRLVGAHAFGVWPDEHLVYFTPVTLREALKRAGFGRVATRTRNIYPENAAMLMSRLRGRDELVPNMPDAKQRSVLDVKKLVREARLLRAIRPLVNRAFSKVLLGDELLAFALKS